MAVRFLSGYNLNPNFVPDFASEFAGISTNAGATKPGIGPLNLDLLGLNPSLPTYDPYKNPNPFGSDASQSADNTTPAADNAAQTGGSPGGLVPNNWIARGTTIILGFIFVAVGLSMFRGSPILNIAKPAIQT
jgi:hypothetical protein